MLRSVLATLSHNAKFITSPFKDVSVIKVLKQQPFAASCSRKDTRVATDLFIFLFKSS